MCAAPDAIDALVEDQNHQIIALALVILRVAHAPFDLPHDRASLGDVGADEDACGEVRAVASGQDDPWRDQGAGATPLVIVADCDTVEKLRLRNARAAYDTRALARPQRERAGVGPR